MGLAARAWGANVVTAVVFAVVLVVAAPASAAILPGTDMPRTETVMDGQFLVWKSGSEHVVCDEVDAYTGRQRELWSQQIFVVDLRTMQRRELNPYAEGLVQIDLVDSGLALGTMWGCDGTTKQGTVDLASGAFTAYESLPEADAVPLLDPAGGGNGTATGWWFTGFADGEALQFLGQDENPVNHNYARFRVTRVDMRSGRTRSMTIRTSVLGVGDPYYMEMARAANGDLVWCSRGKLRRWSYATGTLTSSTLVRRGYRRRLSGREMRAECGLLDPDSGVVYRETRRFDTYPLSTGRRGGVAWRRQVAYSPSAPWYGRSRCCIRIHDTARNIWRVVPPRRSGPHQNVIGVNGEIVVWNHTTEWAGDQVVGPLHYSRLGDLPEAVRVTSVRRRGGRITVRYRLYRAGGRSVMMRRRAPRWLDFPGALRDHQTCGWFWGVQIPCPYGYLSKKRTPGMDRYVPTGTFEPPQYNLYGPDISPLYHSAQSSSFTFRDKPGKQLYYVGSEGFVSRPLTL